MGVLPGCDSYVPEALQADEASTGAIEGDGRHRQARGKKAKTSKAGRDVLMGDESLLDVIVERGELRLAITPGFLPFVAEERDALAVRDMVRPPLPPEPRDIVGFDIELARVFAESLGVKLTLVKRKGVAEALDAVAAGEADIAMSGLSRTLERAKRFYFSDPYHVSGLVILVPKSADIRSLSALKKAKNLRVLVKPNTTSATFAKRHLSNLPMIPAKDEATFCNLLDKGGMIGVLDAIKARDFQARQTLSGQYRLLENRRFTDEPFTIVMPRDEVLRHYINYALVDFKNSGKLEDLTSQFAPWFGSK